jgi:hypothetical protein
MSEYEELRQRIADYLTQRFIYDPAEVPRDECHAEAENVLAEVYRTLETVTPRMLLERDAWGGDVKGEKTAALWTDMLRASPLKDPEPKP